MERPTRRTVLAGALAAASAAVGAGLARPLLAQPRARVTVRRVTTYDADLAGILVEALADHPDALARARGGRVVLKPNLVEHSPARPINTDPRLVAAAVEAFRHHGAREVLVAEGPGHRRDTEALLAHTGLGSVLDALRVPFVDLNVDRTRNVRLDAGLAALDRLELAATALDADLLVSMPKAKTHHWAGATLSMKNLFGLVPGHRYGWPKNPLHQAGIPECIAEIWHAVRPGLAIVDGIVGMQGDGPIMGRPAPLGVLVLGENLPAVDTTVARLMGLRPSRIRYLRYASRLGGTTAATRIAVVGDRVDPLPFEVLPMWKPLRA